MTDPILTYRGTVYPWHCDHMGHMNVMWYVGKFDEATWNLFGTVGLTSAYMRSNGSGTAGVEQNIVYKKELMAGDLISVYSRVLEVKDRVVRFKHEMRLGNTEEVVATMIITAVHLDTSARKATGFPAEVKAKFEALALSV